MAAEEEIVRVSYANLEQIVLSTKPDATDPPGKHEGRRTPRQQKSRRPAQQIYRPGQLRQTRGQRSGQRNGETQKDVEGGQVDGATEEDWDSVELRVNSTDEDKGKASRESSGDVFDKDIHQRLDDLHIESPPRETDVEVKPPEKNTGKAYSSSKYAESRDKDRGGGGRRRGKRPDMQIYIPRGRLGEREKRSEEKDNAEDYSPSPYTEDGKDRGEEKAAEDEEGDDLVVSDSADSLRKVKMKNKGGSMRVTVMNESPIASPSVEGSPSVSRKEFGASQRKTFHSHRQEPGHKDSDPPGIKMRMRDQDQRNRGQQWNNERFAKHSGQGQDSKGRKDSGSSEMTASQDIRKQNPQRQERPVKSYSKNRRSNSSDSRLKDSDQEQARANKQGKGQFSSETFPRTKGAGGKNAQGKGAKEMKSNGREGDKFYWGMKRQRTGSMSSEASVASNPSNGSFYSGSSDFTEDDEPEHILNWGEEVEKAHLEELARLVHDGAQKLTSSLEAYPGSTDFGASADKEEATAKDAGIHQEKLVIVDKMQHGKSKEGRPRRRNRRRKNSSRQESRDSSVHSSIHGDDAQSERGHRRRRNRHNSQGSQGGFDSQRHHQQRRPQQQPQSEGQHGETGGDGNRGNRSGLQVTVGHNNRHVEISRGGGGGRQRHRSDEKWDPHTVRDYDMEEGEEDWDREIDHVDERDFGRGEGSHKQQRREKEPPPRFRRESGGRGRRGSGRDLDSGRHQGGRTDAERFRHDDYYDDGGRFDTDDRGQQRDFDRREYVRDQRAVHPAHDASGSGPYSNTQGRGRNRQDQNWRKDERGGHSSQMNQRRPVERGSSLNHDDLAISHKARGGGLLRLPSQPQEPPRPHSNPTPAAYTDSFHHHHDNHHSGASGGGPSVGSNTRGPSHGKKQLFDPKNPSKPIVIPDSNLVPPQFEDTDKTPSPGAGSGPMTSSPDSPHGQPHPYPPPFYPPDYHPAFGFRPPMPPFAPTGPYMGGFPPGSIPPHVFYRFPRMPPADMASYYGSPDFEGEGMMSVGSKSQCHAMAEQILRDSHPFDSQLGNILSRRPNSDDSLRMVNQIRAELQNRLEQVILLDIEVASKHNVEQMLWKGVYYQVIESYRKRMGDESQDSACKQKLMEVLDEGTRFFENLLKKLQSTYEFDLEVFTDGNRPIPENVGRNVKLALLSAQRVMMFLGDIARYREQASDTTNYGKARHWYLKAQKIHPRNGRPYNQLAILAVYTRRKLDAVYYYMRSLAASNPILTARESLVSLFDEVRRKVDAVEKKRFEERRHRQALLRKRQSRGPRVEIWVLPDGTSTQDRIEEGEDEEDLSSLSAIELNKRFVLTYLNVHGKLFTKINFEVFAESSSLMLQEFQTLIQHSPCVFSSTRLLQLMVINMFSIDNTALKDESLEENCRSLLQEHAVEIGLDMFGLLVHRSSELLAAHMENENSSNSKGQTSNLDNDNKTSANRSLGESPAPARRSSLSTNKGGVDEDLHLMLPALKTWVDWMMCHAHLWNPHPLNRPPDLGPQIDVWKNLATFCDLLNTVETKQGCLIREQKEGYEPVILHEDTTLAGFVPMLSAPQEVFYADSGLDKQQAEDWLRVEKLRLFGEYLCGVEPPMLAFNVENGKYYSVAPSPTRSEEKLGDEDKEESNSGEESDDVIIEHDDSGDDENKDNREKDDIEKLKAKKAELSKRREEHEKNKENMEAILDSHRHAKIELEVRPIFLIPDTNCFIDHFHTLKKILLTKKYTLVVPLVVINELDGLARGARDQQYDSPDHALMVKSQAQAAIEFLEAEFETKNPNLRAQTSKGSVLETIAFRSEESDGSGINDDIILNCSLHYCKDMAREFMPKDKDHPVRLYREVVLLTDDRNLRLKAHTCNVPVKDVPNFKKWSRIS